MRLISIIALACALAGFVMMYLGYRLSKKQLDLQASLQTAIDETSDTVRMTNKAVAQAAGTTEEGMSGTLRVEAATPLLGGTSEYVKGLAELARNVGGLTPAVAAFIIATILFFLAATLAAIDRIAAP